MLNKEDWLRKAQGLCIGRQERIFHGRERRPNLIIWNHPDKWSAYCQACRKGGVVMKEHVRLTLVSPETTRSNLVLPLDLQSYRQLDEGTLNVLAQFLARKGMDNYMLPEWHYSCTRKRIMICTDGGWLGRDVTDTALEKWLTFNAQQYLFLNRMSTHTVLVEDAFSYFKVGWATKGRINCNVICALGTGLKDIIMLLLLNSSKVQFMFDGDPAGYRGAAEGVARCRGFNVPAVSCCAPAGYDPKDLSGEAIRSLILGDTSGRT